MSDRDPETVGENWTELMEQMTGREAMEQMNSAISQSIEQNVQTQAAFVESWVEAFDGVPSTIDEADEGDVESMVTEGLEGYGQAYEVWIDAAERMAERVADAAQGEDVSITEFRDIWLQSANEAFSEVMSTTAFAAGTGQIVSNLMKSQQQINDLNQDTLEQLGFATRENVDEVGARLIELERRQHDLSKKLDRVLDELKSE